MTYTIIAKKRESTGADFRGRNRGFEIIHSPQRVFDGMNAELKEKVQQIVAWYQTERKRTLLTRYDLGLIVKDIYDHDTGAAGGRYGSQAMKQVCQVLKGIDDGLLYDCLNLVKCYSREEVEELATLQNEVGRPLTWTHVLTLIRVTDSTQRNELLQRTLNESLTVAELDQQYRTQVKDPAEPRGRKLAVPKNLDGALLQQGMLADKFLARSESVWGVPEHSLQGLAKDLCSSEITEKRVQALKEHAEKLRRLAQLAVHHAEEAEVVYRKYSDILSRQLPAPTPADEDEAGTTDSLAEEEDPVPGEFAAEQTVVRFPTDEDEPDMTEGVAGEVNRLDSPLALAG
jgi:hypothetical protein